MRAGYAGSGLTLALDKAFSRESPGITKESRPDLRSNGSYVLRFQLAQSQSLARAVGLRHGNQHLSRTLLIQRGPEKKDGEEEQAEKRYKITLSTGTRDNLTEGEAIVVLNEAHDSLSRDLELYEGEHKMIKQNRDTDAFIGVGGFLTDLFGEDFPDVAMWDEPRGHLARARTALWTKNFEAAGSELAAAHSSYQKCKETWLSYKEQLPNAGTKAQVGVVVIAVLAVVIVIATGGTAAGAAAGEGTAAGGTAAGGTAAGGTAAGGTAAGGTAAGGAAAGGTAAGGTAAGGSAAAGGTAAGGVVVGGGVTTAATAATTLPGVSLVNMLITEVGSALASGNGARAAAVLGAYASTPSGRQALLQCGQVVIAHMQQPGLTQEEFQMLKQIADSFFQFARGG
jgi:hypothetical protein